MRFEYETSRLLLQSLDDCYAYPVLDFLRKGRAVFDAVEAPKPGNFYTLEFQQATLASERAAFLQGTYMRYYFFDMNNPDEIIGTCSFSNILRGAYRSCLIGYKILPEYQKKGYAIEGISRLVTAIFEEEHLHRIEAYTLPDNRNSINLLMRLGFDYECLARSVINIDGTYRDHNRYVLLNPLDML